MDERIIKSLFLVFSH